MRASFARVLAIGGLLFACGSHPHPHPEGPPSAKGPATPVEPPPDAAIEPAPPSAPTPGPVTSPSSSATVPAAATAAAAATVPATATATATATKDEAPAPTGNPCGPDSGTIGTGQYGTIGHGSGYGAGGCGHGGVADIATFKLGDPVAKGGRLDVAIVLRYLRRRSQAYLYCYEKRLLVVPKIKGAVKLHFVIDASGVVGDASAKGVDDDVSACVRDTVVATEFPKPKDGKPVTVDVAFTYAPKK